MAHRPFPCSEFCTMRSHSVLYLYTCMMTKNPRESWVISVPAVTRAHGEVGLSCACGGFPSIRHNELRKLTAQFLTETCHGVGIEPPLQP